jgi:hypothetical protein
MAELSAFSALRNIVLSTTLHNKNPLSLSRKAGQRHSKSKEFGIFSNISLKDDTLKTFAMIGAPKFGAVQ